MLWCFWNRKKHMFAEQQHATLAERLFRLGPNYQRPQPPSSEKVVSSSAERSGENSIKQIDIFRLLLVVKELVKEHGEERALFLAVIDLLMDMLALRQEMLGTTDTQEVVTQLLLGKDNSIFIRSTHYAKLQNLDGQIPWDKVPPEFRDRYKLEIDQLKNLFRVLAEQA